MKTKRYDEITGYKLDFATNTLTINYKFSKALSDYGSPEYARYKAILADFPGLKVICKAGRTITTTRPTKRLTYDNMEIYMGCFENSDVLQRRFDVVKRRSKILASPYKYVRDWFEAQFPDYQESTVFAEEKPAVVLVPIPDTSLYKQKDNDGTDIGASACVALQ